MDPTVLIAIIVIFSCVFIILQIHILVSDCLQRKRMIDKKARLEERGVTPNGATLTHGMYLDANNKIVADQKESIAWYKRLI